MGSSSFNPANWGVGAKITAFTFGLVGIILAALVFTISLTTSALLESRAGASVASELRGVLNMVALFDKAVTSEAVGFSRILAASYSGAFSIDADTVDIAGVSLPVLKNDGKPVNLDFTIADRFTAQTGAIATVFVRSGEDFVRVSTSIKQQDGARAVGTMLDRAEPAYAMLRAGQAYSGPAAAFGRQFITRYEPILGAGGRLIGALSVGVDITADMLALKAKIREIKIGDTGYFFVLNSAPGKGLGELLVHPVKEGANLLGAKDSDGRLFIQEVLEKKTGVISYPWLNAEKGETTPREKSVTYGWYPQWNWVIAGGTYKDEITREAASLRNRYIGFGLVALTVFAVLLFLM
ncbi:MAG: Cache 3/Cache 2 fusion domain-containing protein, partial [Pseudomonadota bacterium]|nr:Cache 3/Cache 2 fusion domain-containing protein [Pseudomonadota bacterium]